MKNLTKFGYLAMVGLILLLSVSCSQSIGTKDKCAWCGGSMITFPTTHGGFETSYLTDFQNRGADIYHPWCAKSFDERK